MAPDYDLDALLPAATAAVLFGVSRQLVHKWRVLGHLTPACRDRRGRPLYRWRDLLAAEATTRANPRSSRHVIVRSPGARGPRPA